MITPHIWSILQDSGRYYLTKEECKIIKTNVKIVKEIKKLIKKVKENPKENPCNAWFINSLEKIITLETNDENKK